MSVELYSEIARYHKIIDKPFWQKRDGRNNGIILIKCKEIRCSFQVNARSQSYTTLSNVTQDALSLAHESGLTCGNRSIPKQTLFTMMYPQNGLHIPVTRKSGRRAEHLQKPICVQASIHITTSQVYTCWDWTSDVRLAWVTDQFLIIYPVFQLIH